MKRMWMAMGFVLMLAMTALAQEENPMQGQGGMGPMGAPEEMKQVSFLVGTWKVASKYNMGDTANWMEATGTCVCTSVLDGCAIMNNYDSEFMGMKFHGMGTLSYNRETKMWQQSWIDNMAGSMSLYQGDFKDGKMICSGEDMMQGQKYLTRITMSEITPTSYNWLLEMSMDGGKTFMPGMKATYTKQ